MGLTKLRPKESQEMAASPAPVLAFSARRGAFAEPQRGARTTMNAERLLITRPGMRRPPASIEPNARPPRQNGREGPLSLEEERRLARRWRTLEDGAALGRLVAAHLGLVIRIAMEFRHSGPPMEDLIQEGNLGLTIAARRFDPTRRTRLATYATYWIRACMLEHVVRSHGPVRIGTTRSQRKIFFGLGRARRKLERLGEATDMASLATVLGVEAVDVEAMTPRLSGRDVSLDAPRGHDDKRPMTPGLAEDAPSPEDRVAGAEEDDRRKWQLYEGLKLLDARERSIIRARHMRQRPATLASLGKRFGISRERVRQLELRAKEKLRAFVKGDPQPVFRDEMVEVGGAAEAC